MEETFRAKIVRETADYLTKVSIDSLLDEHESPFLLLDMSAVRKQYRRLQALLPMVRHHFAIKAFRHPAVIAAVDECGGYFDVMTNSDIDLVRMRNVGPERCIHTNPIKKSADIDYARAFGIDTFVVDNFSEVDKFSGHAGDIRLLIRLSFRNPGAKSDLSYKFGIQPDEACQLVDYVLKKGLKVAGFSLHVGSQIDTAQAYVEAIEQARKLIDEVESTYHIRLEILDIGGGFPVDYTEPMPTLEDIASAISELLRPLSRRLRILSEPGRFVVAPAGTLIVRVVGRSIREGRPWYYIDDGLYGSYSNVIFEQVTPPILTLKELRQDGLGELAPAVIAGPTCDSVDVITKDCPMPDLEIGDFIVSPRMGAYTSASATEYNGIERTPVVVLEGPNGLG